jgi:hypothetical protein
MKIGNDGHSGDLLGVISGIDDMIERQSANII